MNKTPTKKCHKKPKDKHNSLNLIFNKTPYGNRHKPTNMFAVLHIKPLPKVISPPTLEKIMWESKFISNCQKIIQDFGWVG